MSNVREAVDKLVEAWNNRDRGFIRTSLHPETKLVMPDGQEIGGVEACLEEGWKGHAAGFPDGRLEVVSAYDDGDVAITEMVLRGTHGGTWAGIAPTQKKIEVGWCNVMKFKDGKVVSDRDYVDMQTIFSQLGV